MNIISNAPIIDPFSGAYGGNNPKYVADAAPRGYFFVFYLGIPETLVKLPEIKSPINTIPNISLYLSAMTVNIDGFDTSMGKVTTEGRAGRKQNDATRQDFPDSVTCTIRERDGLPIIRIMSAWSNMIADLRTGGRHYNLVAGDTALSTRYKCKILVAYTKQDYSTLQLAVLYSGCFPDKVPYSAITNQDITTVDNVPDHNIGWSFDGVPEFSISNPQIEEMAKSLVTTYRGPIETVRKSLNIDYTK